MKIKNTGRQKGFSLVEIVVVLGIMTTFLGLITLSLTNRQRSSSLLTSADVLLSDMKGQQAKAMVGDTEGRSSADNYGIYFAANSYTLFHGSAYIPSESSNFTVTLDPELVFSEPGKEIIFTRFGGEVVNYSTSNNTITLQDTPSTKQRTLQYNKYGVIVSEN